MPAPIAVAGLTALVSFLAAIFKVVLDWVIKLMTKRGLAIAFFLVSAGVIFGVAYAAISALVSAASSVSLPYANYLVAVIPSNAPTVISAMVGIEFAAYTFRWGIRILGLKTDAMMR